jgi:hypothetical protein
VRVDAGPQGDPVDVLEREVWHALVAADGVDGDDVRVDDAGGGAGFVDEVVERASAARRAQHLQRDLASEDLIARASPVALAGTGGHDDLDQPRHWHTRLHRITLAVVFQLAHVLEGVRFPRPDAQGELGRGFMEHELLTTANFGTPWLCRYITGELGHQIEHHLFPMICHIHDSALSPIVAGCARDHGLPDLYSGSFLDALRSHTRLLRRLGQGEDVDLVAAPFPRDAASQRATAAPGRPS